jgi:hypothetical protein
MVESEADDWGDGNDERSDWMIVRKRGIGEMV